MGHIERGGIVMENITVESLQYRNIVRKFFFRQNPPQALTKEEFVETYGESYENTYYTYLYSYLSQYVSELDQRVDKEISEGAVNDQYLAEIEKELEKNKDTKTYPNKQEEQEEEKNTENSAFQKMEKKKNTTNPTKKDEEIEEEIEEEVEEEQESRFSSLKNLFKRNKKEKKNKKKEKNGFFQRVGNKIKETFQVPSSKTGTRKRLIDVFSALSLVTLLATGAGIRALAIKTIAADISLAVGSLSIGGAFLVGGLTTVSLWTFHQLHQSKRTGIPYDGFEDFEDDFEDDYEDEDVGFIQKLKDKFSLDNERGHEEVQNNDEEIGYSDPEMVDDVNEKESDSPSIFTVQRKNDNRKPKFNRSKEENHKPLQVGDSLLEHVDGEIVSENKPIPDIFKGMDDEISDMIETDEEIQAAREPVKIKIK